MCVYNMNALSSMLWSFPSLWNQKRCLDQFPSAQNTWHIHIWLLLLTLARTWVRPSLLDRKPWDDVGEYLWSQHVFDHKGSCFFFPFLVTFQTRRRSSCLWRPVMNLKFTRNVLCLYTCEHILTVDLVPGLLDHYVDFDYSCKNDTCLVYKCHLYKWPHQEWTRICFQRRR